MCQWATSHRRVARASLLNHTRAVSPTSDPPPLTHTSVRSQRADDSAPHTVVRCAAPPSTRAQLTHGRCRPPPQVLRSYVHEAARLAIESMSIDMVAEIRTVTTIFVNIQGLEEDFENGELERVQKVGAGVGGCGL